MAERREIRVPDIGDFDQVEVVEILVRPGDRIAVDDPLVSIESEKATMEIPSASAGVILELAVKQGDRVSQGSLIALLEVGDAPATAPATAPAKTAKPAARSGAPAAPAAPARSTPSTPSMPTAPTAVEPSSGAEFESIELDRPMRRISIAAANPVPDRTGLPHASPLVRRFARELGVPIGQAPASGPHGRILIDDVKRHVRDRFGDSDGSRAEEGRAPEDRADASRAEGERVGAGVIRGGTQAAMGAGIPSVPFVDPARFGPVSERALSRIQKVSGPALHRSWLNVPHVTQHDEADITELERFRRDRKEAASAKGVKLSPLLFVMKAVVVALREFEVLRSTLAPERDRLLVKDYFHLGIAVDTDQGLVVPVVRDVDRKGVVELAAELAALAERARARKLGPEDLSGACFTISSLGGIGGTAFSPIVNAPEVAILGLSKTQIKPVWRGPSPIDLPSEQSSVAAPERPAAEAGRFEPRLVLPMSLSYDHRVVDGALAVRFTTRLAAILADPIQLLL